MSENTVNRRAALGRLAGLGAGAVFVVTLPSTVSAAPVDPVDVALAELMEASLAVEDTRRTDRAALGDAVLGWVGTCVALHDRLQAEHGEVRGEAIWTEAMERHRRWYCELRGLDPARYA
jgi:hypothetical protein